jgi:hypothetical protein
VDGIVRARVGREGAWCSSADRSNIPGSANCATLDTYNF